jgi:hypothetical protein
MDDCKYYNDRSRHTQCRRHSPIVIANPKYRKGIDESITLTEYPIALCPCGDFTEIPSPVSLQAPESPVSG